MKQVTEAQKAEAEAGLEGSGPAPSTYSSEAPADGDDAEATPASPAAGGTLASDEALAALREKLTGG
jgi:small subunit ribosomal protein S1